MTTMVAELKFFKDISSSTIHLIVFILVGLYRVCEIELAQMDKNSNSHLVLKKYNSFSWDHCMGSLNMPFDDKLILRFFYLSLTPMIDL